MNVQYVSDVMNVHKLFGVMEVHIVSNVSS